jgi:hypothetical protein
MLFDMLLKKKDVGTLTRGEGEGLTSVLQGLIAVKWLAMTVIVWLSMLKIPGSSWQDYQLYLC